MVFLLVLNLIPSLYKHPLLRGKFTLSRETRFTSRGISQKFGDLIKNGA